MWASSAQDAVIKDPNFQRTNRYFGQTGDATEWKSYALAFLAAAVSSLVAVVGEERFAGAFVGPSVSLSVCAFGNGRASATAEGQEMEGGIREGEER